MNLAILGIGLVLIGAGLAGYAPHQVPPAIEWLAGVIVLCTLVITTTIDEQAKRG